MMRQPLPPNLILNTVTAALDEDLGDAGDITSNATIPADKASTGVIAARKSGIIAGAEIAQTAFKLVDAALDVTIHRDDGDSVNPGDVAIVVKGSARSILTAERTALNYMGHLSGIATATRALVDAVSGTDAKIVCTRKTTPGLRAFEKYAVRCGGGRNHRFGLYDAVMIKDNHIAASGSIENAVAAARDALGHMVKIEVEADHIEQVEKALSAGADIIMLDNMSTDEMILAVNLVRKRAVLEASGNITVDSVRAVAQTGVDIISSGWITHSAPTLDLGMDFS